MQRVKMEKFGSFCLKIKDISTLENAISNSYPFELYGGFDALNNYYW